eukprot:m.953522 g.953522  ORF g.953522 m.953522 type:complete len:131 (-) comp23871_c1_seq7:5216-5608(-)
MQRLCEKNSPCAKQKPLCKGCIEPLSMFSTIGKQIQRVQQHTQLLDCMHSSLMYPSAAYTSIIDLQLVMTCSSQVLWVFVLAGDCLTVTGRTLAENLDVLPDLTPGQDVVVPFSTYSAPTLLCVVVAERA